MGRRKKLPLRFQLMELQNELLKSVERAEVYTDNTDGMRYIHQGSGIEDYRLRQSLVILDVEMLSRLSTRGIRLLLLIASEMKLNNVFWRCENPTSNQRMALAELKDYELLLATQVTGLYIVNPFKIRRGKPLAAVMASLADLDRNGGVMDISDLRPPKQALLSPGR